MTNYLLKTQHNETLSETLHTGATDNDLTFEIVTEAFSESCWQKELGVQKIPCIVAIAEIQGVNTVVHQTDSIYQIAGFQAAADAALALLEAE